jgi:hypothetical protein
MVQYNKRKIKIRNDSQSGFEMLHHISNVVPITLDDVELPSIHRVVFGSQFEPQDPLNKEFGAAQEK